MILASKKSKIQENELNKGNIDKVGCNKNSTVIQGTMNILEWMGQKADQKG